MFESVKMNELQEWNVNLVKSKAEELLNIITKTTYDGRYKDLAITNLEECVMWATKGISRTNYEE